MGFHGKDDAASINYRELLKELNKKPEATPDTCRICNATVWGITSKEFKSHLKEIHNL